MTAKRGLGAANSGELRRLLRPICGPSRKCLPLIRGLPTEVATRVIGGAPNTGHKEVEARFLNLELGTTTN